MIQFLKKLRTTTLFQLKTLKRFITKDLTDSKSDCDSDYESDNDSDSDKV